MLTVTPADRLLVDGVKWHAGFRVGFIPAGSSARRETGGPLVDGPWAYAFGLACCIDNHGGTTADIAREEAAGKVKRAKLGDVILVDGLPYQIVATFNDNIDLKPVEAE